MNASKLMKVTYFDPKSDIRLLCYADTVVWDTKPAPTLIALRFGGYPERVQGLADAIYGGATIEIEDDTKTPCSTRQSSSWPLSWPWRVSSKALSPKKALLPCPSVRT